jgi:hypothetical protein
METSMRLWQTGWLIFPLALAGCGGGDKPASTLTVTCHGGVALVGARSVDVLGDLANGHTTIAFPDPANRGKTGTLTVLPGDRCTVAPAAGSGG